MRGIALALISLTSWYAGVHINQNCPKLKGSLVVLGYITLFASIVSVILGV